MCLNNFFHIAQSKSKALHVVNVTTRYAVKLIEYFSQVFPANANSVVLKCYHYPVSAILGKNSYFGIALFVLHGIVEEVVYHVGYMHLIG